MSELVAIEAAHHAGPRLLPRLVGMTDHKVVYRYIRDTHDFLTDDNHFVAFRRDDDGSLLNKIDITKPFESEGYDWWINHWFSQGWDLVTPETYDARIADYEESAAAKRAMADTHRDTVRGRKARRADLSLVSEYERLIRVEQSRKQQLLAGRYDWFPNLVDENAEPA